MCCTSFLTCAKFVLSLEIITKYSISIANFCLKQIILEKENTSNFFDSLRIGLCHVQKARSLTVQYNSIASPCTLQCVFSHGQSSVRDNYGDVVAH